MLPGLLRSESTLRTAHSGLSRAALPRYSHRVSTAHRSAWMARGSATLTHAQAWIVATCCCVMQWILTEVRLAWIWTRRYNTKDPPAHGRWRGEGLWCS